MSEVKKNMPDKIVIDPMKFEDVVDVYKLGNKLFPSTKWQNLYRTWDEYEIMEKYISDGEYCLVARCNGKLVGFLIGAIVEKKKNPWIYGYILWTGVKPAFNGQGVGKKLLSKITLLFRKAGVRIILADTSVDNEKALSFFHKNGFKSDEGHVFLSKNISR